jgi:hypothetical protein
MEITKFALGDSLTIWPDFVVPRPAMPDRHRRERSTSAGESVCFRTAYGLGMSEPSLIEFIFN